MNLTIQMNKPLQLSNTSSSPQFLVGQSVSGFDSVFGAVVSSAPQSRN